MEVCKSNTYFCDRLGVKVVIHMFKIDIWQGVYLWHPLLNM